MGLEAIRDGINAPRHRCTATPQHHYTAAPLHHNTVALFSVGQHPVGSRDQQGVDARLFVEGDPA